MIQSFLDQASEDIFNGINSRFAREACPQGLWRIAVRKLDQLDSVSLLEELSAPPGNHLAALTGTRRGQYSIRINRQYRICFRWGRTEPFDVVVTDYH